MDAKKVESIAKKGLTVLRRFLAVAVENLPSLESFHIGLSCTCEGGKSRKIEAATCIGKASLSLFQSH